MRFLVLAAAFIATMPLVSKIFATAPAHDGGGLAEDGRGRSEARSKSFSFRHIKDILIRVFTGIGEHGTSLLAAGVAFYALFALFPALGAATWIFGLLANPATIHSQLASLQDVLPAEAWKLVDQQLNALTSKSTPLSLAGVVSLFIAVYSARLAASSMMEALNRVYGLTEPRGFFTTNAIAILFTLVAIGILLIAVGFLIVLPILFNFAGLSSVTADLAHYARWPTLAIVMGLALAFTYRYGPNRRHAPWKWLTWGSATATILWLIASSGFSWYVAAFNSYDKVYGSIGAVIVLLFWFWLTTFTGLLGAELDNAIERSRGEPPVSQDSPKAR